MKPRYRRTNPRKAARNAAIQRVKSRIDFRREARELIYSTLRLKYGFVPCFVCAEPVDEDAATLEHVIPLSKGGKDKFSNYAISHERCNQLKGDTIILHRARL